MRQAISWINEHKNVWRVAVLVLLPVAFLGPWAFDQINVPARYPCSPPNIRLEGDFCGVPLLGIQMFAWIIGGLISVVVGLITGKVELAHRGFEFLLILLYSLFVFLLILPIINTILLILRRDRKRQRVFHIVVCGLDLAVGLLWGMSHYPRFFYALWGIWLYIVLIISALVWEALALAAGKRPIRG